MHSTTRFTGVAAGLVLAFGALVAAPGAQADEVPTEPCAAQAAQVAKAEDALARVTAVFEKQKTKVKVAKEKVARAEKANQRGKAKEALIKAKDKKQETKKVRKAQVQRLAKATERLEKCQAAEPTPEAAA